MKFHGDRCIPEVIYVMANIWIWPWLYQTLTVTPVIQHLAQVCLWPIHPSLQERVQE